MKRKNVTRNALFTSIISLLLCVSMLVGTTFAWFTDEVNSGTNVIAAGNLDIDVMYANTPNGAYETIENVTDLFVAPAGATKGLWEPGHTEVAYLKVVNNGTLTLKYQFKVDAVNEVIGKSVQGNDIKLSEILKFAATAPSETAPAEYTRATAQAAAEASDANLLGYTTETLTLAPKAERYIALVVYMPESTGNEANYRGSDIPTINFKLTALATQVENEEDSFGSDYDDAWVDGFDVYNEQDLNAAINNGETYIDMMADIELTGPIVIPASETTYALRSSGVTINLNGKTLSSNVGRDADGNRVHVIVNNGNLELVNGTVTSAGENGGSAIYNAEGASLTIEGVTVNGAPIVGTEKWPSYGINNYGTLTVKSATVKTYHGGIATCGDAVTVIYDATIDVGQSTQTKQTSWALYVTDNGELTVHNGVFKNTKDEKGQVYGGGYICATSSKNTVINGGIFDKTEGDNNGSGFYYNNTNLVINGGTFDANPSAYVAPGYKAVETSSGWMVISADNDYVADGVLKSADEKTFYLSSKEGFKWMESQSDSYFAGKTVTLEESIDFGGETINAVRFWEPENKTTFDGNGMTISNFVLENTDGNAGLFNGTMTVKNLNIVGAEVTGKYAGVIAGNMYGDIINCTVKDSVINGTYWQTGALVGQYNGGNIIDCVVENCEINGLAAVGGLVGILNESAGERKIENCTVKDCEINQTGSFGGDYDKMFGVVTGCVNIENSTVTISGVYEDNTVKGAASDVLCGDVADSTKVYVLTTADNGMKLKEDVATGAMSLSSVADLNEEDVTIPAEVSALGNAVFAGNANITSVTIPATVTDFGASGVSETNASGGAFKGSNVEAVTLSEGMTEIPAAAFNGATKLTSVNIPASVEKIGVNAFRSTALTELTIPATVKEIACGAFRDMDSLTTVTIEGDEVTLPGYVFRDCSALRTVYLNMNTLTLNGSMNFANASSNNPNTNNITFYCKNNDVADAVKAHMGVGSYVAIYVNGTLYAEIN